MYLEIKKPYFSSNKRKKQGKRAIADLLKKQKKIPLCNPSFSDASGAYCLWRNKEKHTPSHADISLNPRTEAV